MFEDVLKEVNLYVEKARDIDIPVYAKPATIVKVNEKAQDMLKSVNKSRNTLASTIAETKERDMDTKMYYSKISEKYRIMVENNCKD